MRPEEDNKDKEREGGGTWNGPVRGFPSTLVLVIRYHDEPYRTSKQPFTIVPQSIDPVTVFRP